MAKHHLASPDFDIYIGDLLVHVESMSATIDDQRQPVYTNGVPDGYVNGQVKCDGDIELDTENFNLLSDVAANSGSFRDMPTFDIIYMGDTVSQTHKQELFGCLINISDLLNNDAKGGEKSRHKVTFAVTSPEFVRINGVPYLSAKDTRNLLS